MATTCDAVPTAEPQAVMIVRRGEPDRFRVLQQTLAAEPVQLIWDRRLRDRRRARGSAAPDRRRKERRRLTPSTWTTLGFVFVRLANASLSS